MTRLRGSCASKFYFRSAYSGRGGGGLFLAEPYYNSTVELHLFYPMVLDSDSLDFKKDLISNILGYITCLRYKITYHVQNIPLNKLQC